MAGGRFAQALQLLIPLLRSDFGDATVLDRAAVCYFRVGDCQTALKLMELLLDALPGNAAAWGKFAAMKASAGDRTGAAAAYRKALELSPENVSFIAGLNLVQPVPVDSPHVSRLKALAASGTVSVAEQVLAHTTLGRIEEKQGNFKLAFAHYKSANELKDADYDAESVGTRVKDQARVFEACRAADAQADADTSRMLFITGMPRSGTTLVESSLSLRSRDLQYRRKQRTGQDCRCRPAICCGSRRRHRLVGLVRSARRGGNPPVPGVFLPLRLSERASGGACRARQDAAELL